MNAIERALVQTRAWTASAHERALSQKATGTLALDFSSGESLGGGLFGGSSGKDQAKYAQFRGWLYSAINALAREAAGQPINVGRLQGKLEEERRASPNGLKMSDRRRVFERNMPKTIRTKAARQEWEILYDHPLLDLLEKPNPIQGRWQFVYSFVASLNLTGWSYVVGGKGPEGNMELYSIPTTWVTPLHKDGPFSEFKIQNPSNMVGGGIILGRENVAFAHLPNPGNLLGALAPSSSQSLAIRIDDHIQTSQERFFQNGVFPSVVVTIGKNPDGSGGSGGVRPVLTGTQRRQIIGAIRKQMTSVENYGNPAIVDGLIEKIDRLSATSNEMGWDKSEDKVRTRILSAFGVHPYILGEPVNVGGYAQAANIEKIFCKQVNTFLDMLSTVITNFVGPQTDSKNNVFVWWESCEPHDPGLRWQNLREARKNGDLSKNEFRAELGFPPDDEAEGNRSPLLDAVGGMQGYTTVANAVGQGLVDPAPAANALALFFQIPVDQAQQLLGTQNESGELEENSNEGPDNESGEAISEGSEEEQDALLEATDALEAAVAALGMSPKSIAKVVARASKVSDEQARAIDTDRVGGQSDSQSQAEETS